MYHLNSVKFLTQEIVNLNGIYQVTKFLKDIFVNYKRSLWNEIDELYVLL